MPKAAVGNIEMETATERIAPDLLSEPHIASRHVSVIHIYDKVKERGDRPENVTKAFDLDVADVYHALARYYDPLEEMERLREKRRDAYESIEVDRPSGVNPPR